MCVPVPSTQSAATTGCWCSTTNQLNCSTVSDCTSTPPATPPSSGEGGEPLSLAMLRRAEDREWTLRGMSGDRVMISPCRQSAARHA